jgi:hypothetical protein
MFSVHTLLSREQDTVFDAQRRNLRTTVLEQSFELAFMLFQQFKITM